MGYGHPYNNRHVVIFLRGARSVTRRVNMYVMSIDSPQESKSHISMTISINYVQKVIIASILSNVLKIKTFPNQDVSVLN